MRVDRLGRHVRLESQVKDIALLTRGHEELSHTVEPKYHSKTVFTFYVGKIPIWISSPVVQRQIREYFSSHSITWFRL
jgi:hypothetical protein